MKKVIYLIIFAIFLISCEELEQFFKPKVLTCTINTREKTRIIINNESFFNTQRKIVYEGKVNKDNFLLKAYIPYVSIINFNNHTFTTLNEGVVIGEKVSNQASNENKRPPEFEIKLKNGYGVKINNNYVFAKENALLIEKEFYGSKTHIPIDIQNIKGDAKFIINDKIFKLCEDTLCVGTKPPKVSQAKIEIQTDIDLNNLKDKTLTIKFDLSKKETERFNLKNWQDGKSYNLNLEGTNAKGDTLNISVISQSGRLNKTDNITVKNSTVKYNIKNLIKDNYTININGKVIQIRI